MTRPTNDELVEVLRRAAVRLNEHFSSVQIVATRTQDPQDDSTTVIKWGQGSWHERLGALMELVWEREERVRWDARRWFESDDEV